MNSMLVLSPLASRRLPGAPSPSRVSPGRSPGASGRSRGSPGRSPGVSRGSPRRPPGPSRSLREHPGPPGGVPKPLLEASRARFLSVKCRPGRPRPCRLAPAIESHTYVNFLDKMQYVSHLGRPALPPHTKIITYVCHLLT